MTSALRTGIYNAAKAATGWSSSTVFFGEAKHGLTGVYCVIYPIGNPYALDSASVYETDYVQFKIYGTVLADVETGTANMCAKFDLGAANITVSGWTVITSMRTMTVPARKTENVWEIDVEYKIETQKAR
jgi:hypothetical protein